MAPSPGVPDPGVPDLGVSGLGAQGLGAQGLGAQGLGARRLVARQPVLNRRQEVIGHELLFRDGWVDYFTGEAESAVRKTLDTCIYLGTEQLAQQRLAFFNCTRESLTSRMVTLLPAETTVLEVLEAITPDEEVLTACRELREMGYRLALDDFTPREEMRPLVELASFVKVDFRQLDQDQRRQVYPLVEGTGAALLAEKIETREEFAQALDEGYDYFQGFYFCRPRTMSTREIPPSRANYVRLLTELSRSPLDLDEVTRIVRMEASLLYRLLRLSNSAGTAQTKEVTGAREAFLLVGEDRFRVMVSVAASAVLGAGMALVTLALERARFCELLAPLLGLCESEQFLLGLLSLVDVMLEAPMETIAQAMPLRAPVRAALLGAVNAESAPLRTVKSFEASFEDGSPAAGGDGRAPADCAAGAAIGEERLAQLYLEAARWAEEAIAASAEG